MKVLLTGATGLIGKEAISQLEEMGCSVVTCTSKNFNLLDLDSIDAFLKKETAEYLLHFAWITGGDYLTNPINEVLCKNSFEMLKLFYKYGGQKAVLAGTCFEYDFRDSDLTENSILKPKTLYAQKKAELNDLCTNFCDKYGFAYAWGRIFYVYGHNEKTGRLTDQIVKKLIHNETVTVKFGQLIRDYMYSKDIANSFIKLLLSNVTGNVNICSSQGISLDEYATTIAKKLKKLDLLSVHYEETSQPKRIVGDNGRLKNEVCYIPKFDFSSALDSILNDYMENING